MLRPFITFYSRSFRKQWNHCTKCFPNFSIERSKSCKTQIAQCRARSLTSRTTTCRNWRACLAPPLIRHTNAATNRSRTKLSLRRPQSVPYRQQIVFNCFNIIICIILILTIISGEVFILFP